MKVRVDTNCWVCEGWNEIKIVFTTEEEIDETKPVYLHL